MARRTVPDPSRRKDPIAAKAKLKSRSELRKEQTQRAIVSRVKKNAAKVKDARLVMLGKKPAPDLQTEKTRFKRETKRHNTIPPAILFSPEVIKQVESMAAIGLPPEDIAACLDISVDRLYRDKKVVPELNEAIIRGRAKGHAQIANVVFTSAAAGNVGTAQWILERKHSAAWRPAPVETHTTLVSATSTPEHVEKMRSLIPRRDEDGAPIE